MKYVFVYRNGVQLSPMPESKSDKIWLWIMLICSVVFFLGALQYTMQSKELHTLVVKSRTEPKFEKQNLKQFEFQKTVDSKVIQ